MGLTGSVQLAAQAVNRRSKRRGVVGKVVDNRDDPACARHHTAHFHAPLDVLKIRQRLCCQGG